MPTFRPDIDDAFEFGFGDKLAPRLGAAYDVRGDGRFKVFGSWGRYYDWTKYELPRGSFGGDTWHIYYRALDTLDLGSLNLTNMPGRDLWVRAGQLPRSPRAELRLDRPEHQADVPGQHQRRHRVSSSAATCVLGAHYVHNNLGRTIEDIGALDASGNEIYVIGNPGEGLGADPVAVRRRRRSVRRRRSRSASTTRSSSRCSRRFSNNYFWSASYVLSRLYGNYSGIAARDEITHADHRQSARRRRSSRPAASRVRAATPTARGTSTSSSGIRTATSTCYGRLPTDRPHVVKLYGAYMAAVRHAVRRFFYGGSGTPITTYVNTTNQTQVFVNGRGDMGRTPVLTRTDLLVSHELKLSAAPSASASS